MTKLFPFQADVVNHIERFQGRTLLALEMGLGKTVCALTYLKNHPELRPVVIVCPASVKYVWESQARQHCGLRSIVVSGRKKPRRGLHKEKGIIIINYDILDSWKDYLKSINPQVVIADESHAIKSPKARRTKALKSLCQNVPHVLMLSGTPIVNRPSELFTTLNILWPKKYKHFWPYAQKFCAPKLRPWGWCFDGASNIEELHKSLVEQGMIRLLKKDVLKDLPEKSRSVVPLDIKNKKEYKHAVTDFLSWLGKQSPAKAKRAKKAESLTKVGYLVRLAAELKMKAVFEWIDNFLESTDEKLILACVHKKIVHMLEDRYPNIHVTVSGKTPVKKRKALVKKFQKSKKTRLFIGQIKSAGTGIDLWASSNVFFVETGFVPGDVLQFESRAHRIGQTKHVFCWYSVAQGTIEENLAHIIQEKQKVVTGTLDGKQSRQQVKLSIHDELVKILKKAA